MTQCCSSSLLITDCNESNLNNSSIKCTLQTFIFTYFTLCNKIETDILK